MTEGKGMRFNKKPEGHVIRAGKEVAEVGLKQDARYLDKLLDETVKTVTETLSADEIVEFSALFLSSLINYHEALRDDMSARAEALDVIVNKLKSHASVIGK